MWVHCMWAHSYRLGAIVCGYIAIGWELCMWVHSYRLGAMYVGV